MMNSTHQSPPPLRSKAEHPGLSQFHCWHTAISEIYRSYKLQQPNQTHVEFPIITRSERGNVSIDLEVTNRTNNMIMRSYWIDYLGREMDRGFARPGQTWYQQTWIGHPWVFRFEHENKRNEQLYSSSVARGAAVHYVPFRIIQHTSANPTISENGNGIHKFSITQSRSPSREISIDIDDPIFPFPSSKLSSIEDAFVWSVRQMEREKSNPKVLLKYLKNICLNPDSPNYRQIRTANKTFWNEVWITASRGILHSLGFEENGAYIETGPSGRSSLPRDRIEHFSSAITFLEQWITNGSQTQNLLDQPLGADGFGRAGFGRAGSINRNTYF